MAGAPTMVSLSEEPVIVARGLGRRFAGREAIRSLDLEIRRGEIFGIVGPDGAGKSTLIQMLCGILDPTRGSAAVLGFDTVRRADRIAARVGYMSQTFSLYGTLSVRENVEFFADLRAVPVDRRRERMTRLLDFSRLGPFLERQARDLSGGMQKKLALATTLIHDPEVLFLDEPTTGVDPVSRRDFWEIVFDFLREGMTVVVATPYLDEAERCERVALMHEGRILRVDAPTALKAQLGGQMAEVWTRDQTGALEALRRDPEVRDAQIFGRSIHALLTATEAYRGVEARLRATGIEIEAARCIEPGLEDVFVALLGGADRPAATEPGAPAPVRAAGPAPPTARQGRPAVVRARAHGVRSVIEVERLTRRFGGFVAVDAISFSVNEGEVFGFLGPNGSGKSTTIRMLTGILAPSGGRARIAGFDALADARRIRPLLGYMSQRFSLYEELTVSENLEFFGGLYGVRGRERRDRKAAALALVGLDARSRERVRDLAGGYRQRLALAAAILHRPRVLLLDEPTSGVDPLSRRRFWDLIFALAGEGVTVLVTTHYMDEAERCHRVAILDAGRVVAMGSPAELRDAVGGRMLELAVHRPLAALRAARDAPGVRQATLQGAMLHVLLADRGESAVAALREHLVRAGHDVARMAPAPLTMEDVFAALVEGGSAARRTAA